MEHPKGVTYARSRLWLGICSVGSIVILSLAALWFDLPHRYLAEGSPLIAIALSLGCYIAVSFPLDLLGGYILPRRYQRTTISLFSFLALWSRAVIVQALIMGSFGYAILHCARRGGILAAVLCAAGSMLALVLFQQSVARVISGFVTAPGHHSLPMSYLKRWNIRPPATVVYHASDVGFVGALVGWPGRERLVLPAAWMKELTPEMNAVEIGRRAGVLAGGERLYGLLAALLWNLLGFSLAASLSGSKLSAPAGLITTALWFTVWSFGGLLLLPSISRPAVFAADEFIRNRGAGDDLLAKTIHQLDAWQDDEPVRSRWVERVFHPVPSVSGRLASLGGRGNFHGAWQCARMTLHLSWACFGFLSRAVHCNCGRPELWVMLPGD